MKPIDVLNRVVRSRITVENLKESIERIQSSLDVHSIDLEEPRVQGGVPSDYANRLGSLEELENRLKIWEERHKRNIASATRLIERLPTPQYKVLYMRYIEGKMWKEIERETNYTRRYCYYQQKLALSTLEKRGKKPY